MMWPPESNTEKFQVNRTAALRLRKEDRMGRLLNSKQRVIGLDMDGLNQQVASKQQRDQDERVEKEKYDQFTIQMSNILQENERKDHAERRRARAELQNVWKLQAKNRKFRAEWDLNDPHQLKKDPVPTQQTAGPSSAQFISGLDSSKETQRRKQQEQREYIDKQLEELRAKEEAERLERERDAAMVREQVALRTKLEEEDARARAENNLHVRQTNEMLLQLKKAQAVAEKNLSESEADNEHSHVQNWNLLLESRSKMVNHKGERVRQEWKGMSPEELDAIRREQLAQQKANEWRRAEEEAFHALCDETSEQNRLIAVLVENAHEQDRALCRKQVQQVHREQQKIYKGKMAEQRQYDTEPQPVWWPFGASDR